MVDEAGAYEECVAEAGAYVERIAEASAYEEIMVEESFAEGRRCRRVQGIRPRRGSLDNAGQTNKNCTTQNSYRKAN